MGIGPFTKDPTANGSHQVSMRLALSSQPKATMLAHLCPCFRRAESRLAGEGA